MQTTATPRTINRARTLANIRERARHITEDYRLIWNFYDKCFMVAHKTDRARRYKITKWGCTCPSRANYGTCKHWHGLRDLARVEIERFTLMGMGHKRARVEEFVRAIKARFGH